MRDTAQSHAAKQTPGPASGGATGSCKKDAVLDCSALFALALGFESGIWRDQTSHLSGLVPLRRALCSVLIPLRLDYAFFLILHLLSGDPIEMVKVYLMQNWPA